MPKPSISREAFEALAARAGLPLTDRQKAEFYEVYGHLEAMTARVRAGGKRSPAAEPAITFDPER